MITLRLSAHSLDKAACPKRYYYYRVLQKAAAEAGPGLTQGIAGHAALAAWRRGLMLAAEKKITDPALAALQRQRSILEQEAAIDKAFAEGTPIPADDYRTPAYLKQIIEQYRAEHGPERWVWEEVEKEFEVELGMVAPLPLPGKLSEAVRVIWTGRRDAIGFDPDSGERFVFDDKFMSRDEGADREAAKNSRALKGYVWAYQKETSILLHGAYLRRTIIRAPTRPKPLNFTLPPDPPIRFSQEQLDEWRLDVLDAARAIVERDPADPAAWRMEESCCRHTFGCCDYLCVCELPPGEDRRRKLESPAFTTPHAKP